MAVTTAAVAIGAASVAAGAVGASKTRKANEKAAKRAESNEEARRQRAVEELDKATQRYNELRAERPGLSVRDFLTEQLEVAGDPELREKFNQLTEDDFRKAQFLADQAALGNVDSFNLIQDAVSGGAALETLQRRNDIALSDDVTGAFNRAMELRSTAIPAGTVRQDASGRLVEGQRADKQVFNLAFETQQDQRDRQFSKLNTILDSDRQIALRQQEKALDFLNQNTAFGQFSRQAGLQSRAERIAFQTLDEQSQLRQIESFQNAAFTDQTKQPVFQSADSSNALISGGFDLALRGLAQGSADK